jgi:hypothetical protein
MIGPDRPAGAALSAGIHAAAKTPLTAVGRFMALPVFHD